MLKNTFIICCVFISQCILAQKASSLEEKSNDTETPFERGNSIIFQDNFDKDAIGDFPAKWNTNKSGAVKKLKGFDNKFLNIADGSVVNIELTKALPINFTAEFDVIIPDDVPVRMASFGFGAKPNAISWLLSPKDGIAFSLQSNSKAYSEGLKFGTQKFSSKDFSLKKLDYKTPLNKIIKIAFSINNKRIRLYIDGVKMVDMPTSFDASFRKNIYFNASTHGAAESKLNHFYISNIIIAESMQDKRSQVLKDLIEKGTASTNAIQFANNSDNITDESNAIIQEFATALKAYPTMQIKIIGHTDTNGNADKNILLSKKRAIAVKAKLISMGIEASRLLTDGKGATEPIESNETETGKAANRRVQFIKL